MTVLATLTAAFSARYFTLDPRLFLAQQRAVYVANLVPLLLHVGGGILALALGPWQFVPRIRARHPMAHRAIGRIYLLSALAAGLGALLLVPKGLYWPVAPLGFAGLATALLLASGMAYATIRRRSITEHQIWMIRSYSLIFAAVTFRVWLTLFSSAGLSFPTAYMSGAWLSWLINLLVAQRLIVRVRSHRSARVSVPDAGS
ncbi:DUF2306 domain-containing protein [Streptacidiphilus rugosus]|uniref:DUF2306 domain-containing protein n=1 Tax=Streptacidiphilus rugosus TaxID=405783 RepID=UPI00068BE14F|nr:DUF2306 domain-containing protein [Streptacidiphilus rugosus]